MIESTKSGAVVVTSLVASFALVVALAACGKKPANNPSSLNESSTLEGDQEGGAGDGGATASTDGDGGAEGGAASTDSAGSTDPASVGTEDSAKTFLAQFTKPGADFAALTKAMRPTAADYKLVFDDAIAAKVEANHAKEWDGGKIVIKVNAKHTDIKVFSASATDISGGKAPKELGAGYKKLAEHLRGGMAVFGAKFTAPGSEKGETYDGLYFVNNRWVYAPKAFKDVDGGPPAGGGGGGGKKGGGKKKK